MDRTAKESLIAQIIRRLNDDELTVLLHVAGGMDAGREIYGPLNIAEDQRDPVQETTEEVRDALVYVGLLLERLRRRL